MPPSAAALSVYDGRSPSEAGGSRERVLVELPRPALADRDDLDSLSPADQRAYVRSLGARGRRCAPRSAPAGWSCATRSRSGARGTASPRRSTPPTSPRSRASACARGRCGGSIPRRASRSRCRGAKPAGGARGLGRRRSPSSTPAPPRPATTRSTATATPRPGADPRAPARRETSGAALAAIVTAAGERAMTIRVAGYGATPEIHGTTDTLLAGLERAVDPDGDGAVDDAVRVALVGVNAPYAGFGDSPEAQAVRGAGKLGTLVVAPAGNEGPGAAAERRRRLAGRGPRRAHRRRHRGRRGRPARRRSRSAAASSPAPPPSAARRAPGEAGRAGDEHRHRGAARGRPSVAGRVALVRAGDNPVAQAAAAAGAGARAVLLAEPRDRPLPMMPAGRVAAPVVGLTGAAAKAALEAKRGREGVVRPRDGGPARRRRARAGAGGGARPAPFSSRGPAFDGTPKPDLARRGRRGHAGRGSSPAPRSPPRGSPSAPRGSPGSGRPRRRPGSARRSCRRVRRRQRRRARPAGAARPARAHAPRRRGRRRALHARRVRARRPARGRHARIQPASRLELELVDADGAVQQTPHAARRRPRPAARRVRLHASPSQALKDLAPGEYRFRATARAPRRTAPTTRRSPRLHASDEDRHALHPPRLPPLRRRPRGARARPRRSAVPARRDRHRIRRRAARAPTSSGSRSSTSTARSCSTTSSTRRRSPRGSTATVRVDRA